MFLSLDPGTCYMDCEADCMTNGVSIVFHDSRIQLTTDMVYLLQSDLGKSDRTTLRHCFSKLILLNDCQFGSSYLGTYYAVHEILLANPSIKVSLRANPFIRSLAPSCSFLMRMSLLTDQNPVMISS